MCRVVGARQVQMHLHAQHVRLNAKIDCPAANSRAIYGDVAYTVRGSLVFAWQVNSYT